MATVHAENGSTVLPVSDVIPETSAALSDPSSQPQQPCLSSPPETTVSTAPTRVCMFRLIVPHVKVGSIIEMKEPRAHIEVLKPLNGPSSDSDCIVLIYGDESDAQLSPAMSATIRVFKRMIGLPDSESNGEGNGAGSVSSVENCFIRLLVNKVQVSVGKEASHFSQIMKSAESAGAQVSFFSFQKLPVYATSDERIIFIKGSSSNVLKAFEKVVGHLSKFVVDLSFISLLKETGRAVPPEDDTVSIWSEISNSMHHTTQTVTGSDYPPSNEMLRFQLNCAIKPQMPQTNWLLYGHPALAGLHPSEIEYPSALKVTQGSATPASDHTVDTWSEISHSMHPTTPQTVIDSDYPPSKKQCLCLNSEMKPQMPHVAWSLDRHSALAERPSGIECSAAPIFTRTMQVPLSYAEEITGIAGENIRYIQRISGATLTEPKRSKDLLSKFTIVIRGTYPQVQTAQQLILEFMAGYKVPLASIYGFEPYGAGNGPRTTYRL